MTGAGVAEGTAQAASEYPDAPHGSEKRMGPPFVVYGHTPRSRGALTACILPGREVVQVPAREVYYRNGGGR